MVLMRGQYASAPSPVPVIVSGGIVGALIYAGVRFLKAGLR
jgi:hypothetical protein